MVEYIKQKGRLTICIDRTEVKEFLKQFTTKSEVRKTFKEFATKKGFIGVDTDEQTD